jgi:hypothetical protein
MDIVAGNALHSLDETDNNYGTVEYRPFLFFGVQIWILIESLDINLPKPCKRNKLKRRNNRRFNNIIVARHQIFRF